MDFGEGPLEPYNIVHLVVAKSREQARYLAWQTDKKFDNDLSDMPNFRTRKLSVEFEETSGIVSEYKHFDKFWRHPKSIDLLNAEQVG